MPALYDAKFFLRCESEKPPPGCRNREAVFCAIRIFDFFRKAYQSPLCVGSKRTMTPWLFQFSSEASDTRVPNTLTS